MPLTLPEHFPRELITHQSWRRVVLCWCLVLLGVVVLNSLCYGLLRWKPINKTSAVVSHKWQLLENCKPDMDLLILGDSSGNQGVDPDVLRGQLGVDSLNLCTIGGGLLLDDRMMLEDYLLKHPAPRAVLLVHVYDIWPRRINRSVLSLFPYAMSELQQRLGTYQLSLWDWLYVWSYRYMPIYHQNVSLKKMLYQPMKYFKHQWEFNTTGYEAKTGRSYSGWKRDVQAHMSIARHRKIVGVNKINVANLKIMTQLAQEHDFELFLVMAPIASELYREKEFRQYYDQIPTALGVYAKQNDKVHLLFKEPFRATSKHMQSADHVTVNAARHYTKLLANRIRWVFQEPQSPKPVNLEPIRNP
ncbi:hypothetical protein JYU15_00230 [bacterium AH-315-I18]|nr:hypothetical protein [bacterium AH-315-I18]